MDVTMPPEVNSEHIARRNQSQILSQNNAIKLKLEEVLVFRSVNKIAII